jgi:glycosyltransferase involved in cell wall biosynthesis
MKIYLGLTTQNQAHNIDELTKGCFEYFDGIISVDGGSNDGTIEILESRKKEGCVIHRKWTNDHDFQNNEILRQGPARIGDWIFLRDSMERFNLDFVKNIRQFVGFCKVNDVRYTHCHGKGFGFEYYDDLFFLGSPHWGLKGVRPKFLNMFDLYPIEKDFAYRIHDGEPGGRPKHNFIDHFLKYYYVYGRTNHLLLGREGKQEEFNKHEMNRQKFRIHCMNLGLDFTIDSLKNYLAKDDWKKDKEFVEMFNMEEILKTFYRWHILKHDLETIQKDRETWNLEIQ